LSTIAIYPGTFDPITLGHFDIVVRASPMFEEVILAVAGSTAKNTIFSVDERIGLATDVLKSIKNVKIIQFNGLMVDCAKENNASVILRGLRAVSDFEYEFQLAGMNRKLMPEADTIFLPTSEKYTYISSSLVREIAKFGGDITDFVPKVVKNVLIDKLAASEK
jgi:pantetheine-phosphate adenylyltransferase